MKLGDVFGEAMEEVLEGRYPEEIERPYDA
jgi:hypothetical protein